MTTNLSQLERVNGVGVSPPKRFVEADKIAGWPTRGHRFKLSVDLGSFRVSTRAALHT